MPKTPLPKTLTLDFETRSPVDLKRWGPWVYAESPETTVLCLAYKVDAEPADIWFPDLDVNLDKPSPDKQRILEALSDPNRVVIAHNIEFERAVWAFKMRPHWPDIPLERWLCCAAMAAARSLPRKLDAVGTILGLKHQKDVEGAKAMRRVSMPRRATKYDNSKWHNLPEDFVKLYEYCIADVESEYDLTMCPEVPYLSPKEHRIWLLDQKVNERGVTIDSKLVESCEIIVDKWRLKLLSRLKTLTSGTVSSTSEIAKLTSWLADQGVLVPDLTKTTVDQLLDHQILNPTVREVLTIRKSLSQSSVKKLPAMLGRANVDGRARSILMYYGAGTGRWTGKGMQLHNLPRGGLGDYTDMAIELIEGRDLDWLLTFFPDPMRVVAGVLRGLLVAAPGSRFISADYNAIEARILCWLACQEDALEAFRRREDLYVAMAARIYRVPEAEVTKDQRLIGKKTVLGCGYQMGAPKFQQTVFIDTGLKLDLDFCKLVIDTYRQTFNRVSSFWYAIEAAAIRCVKTKQAQMCGVLRFQMNGRFLEVVLPSGRAISYFAPRIVEKPTPWGEERAALIYTGSDAGHWTVQDTYGGKLTENVVQGIARDALAWAMPRVEAAGYPIVFHVHDEIIAEVELGKGSLQEYCDLIGQVPQWLKGCPISVEGWEGVRYRK